MLFKSISSLGNVKSNQNKNFKSVSQVSNQTQQSMNNSQYWLVNLSVNLLGLNIELRI
ncbi:hypothetical protein RB653_007237 [Dictyostelium firmibasis]|uniref:Uncharacterized protein n=1 Tax=Dictyostelium firmibasis TaxID=79012 RepID=A0AAN7TNB0_9MYCE